MRDACCGAKLALLEARRGVHPKGSAVAGVIENRGLPTPVKEKYLIVGGNVLVTVSQACSTVTSTKTLYVAEEDFTGLSTGDITAPQWALSSTVTATVQTDGGGNTELKLETSTRYGGMARYFSTTPGTSYTMKVKIKNTHQVNVSVRRRDPNNWANFQQVSGQLKSASSGYVELTFTFTAEAGWEYFLHVQNNINTGTAVTYYADDIRVYYTGTVTETLCTDDNSYRYGFNGKEKVDEEYGIEGTFYDYGFRVYDSRIAKFLSVDPLIKKFPELTPYQFAANTPIQAVDLDGLEVAFAQLAGRVTAPLPGLEIIGISVGGSLGIAIDIHGNGVIYYSVNGGLGAGFYAGAGVEGGSYPTGTVDNISGWGVSVGYVSSTTILVGEPIGPQIGIDVSLAVPTSSDELSLDQEAMKDISNYKLGVTFAPPNTGYGAGIAGHGVVSSTHVFYKFSLWGDNSKEELGAYMSDYLKNNPDLSMDFETFYNLILKTYNLISGSTPEANKGSSISTPLPQTTGNASQKTGNQESTTKAKNEYIAPVYIPSGTAAPGIEVLP